MKFLVFSDSHEYTNGLDRAIEKHKDATHILHLGDVSEDVFYLNSVYGATHCICGVCGNNDFSAPEPFSHIVKYETRRIYMTHGHREHVKFSLYELKAKASSEKCDVCLFGHTHKQFYECIDGIHFINPGSIGYFKQQYALIDITKDKTDIFLY